MTPVSIRGSLRNGCLPSGLKGPLGMDDGLVDVRCGLELILSMACGALGTVIRSAFGNGNASFVRVVLGKPSK